MFQGIKGKAKTNIGEKARNLVASFAKLRKEEERQFSTISAISKATSNGHPEHIIPNCIIGTQAEQKFRCKKTCFVDRQSKIGKFATHLPDFPDTVIPQELLENEVYQKHLEQIGDFLLCGKEVWWHTDEESKEVLFHDSKGQPEFRDQGPPMHHFLPFIVKGCILRESGKNVFHEEIFNYPSEKLRCTILVGL